MLDNLKRKLYLRRLNQLEHNLQRSRKVHNLHTAKYVGIVAQTASEQVFSDIMAFKNSLGERGIRTAGCILYPNKQIPNSFLMRKDVEIVGNDALNWLCIPSKGAGQTFVNESFDLLIDLSVDEVLPVRWLSALSRAQCKVGLLPYANNPFDLIVNSNLNKPMALLIKDITDILLTLNNTTK